MSTHLVTGKAGYEHVKASDHGALHAAIMGGGEFVLEGGEQFACQVISNNKVRIFDGEALMQGRHIRIDRNTYEETTHDNGVQGYKRIDLVVLTYTKDEGTGVEDVALEVIKGTPSESNPSVPSYVTGDILNNGELKNQMPLYKIPFDGLSIGEPVKMFTTVPTLQTMKEETDAKVDAKIAEMNDEFAELEAGIEDKIAEAGKPLSSNADDWALIENYGEYSADAKTVGEEIAKVNNSLTADNAQAFRFAYDSESGKYGYKVREADTDVFVPFKSGSDIAIPNVTLSGTFSTQSYGYLLTKNEEYFECSVVGTGISGKGYVYTFSFDYDFLEQFSQVTIKRTSSNTNNKMTFTHGDMTETVGTTEIVINKSEFSSNQPISIEVTSTAVSAPCWGYIRFYY